MKIINAFKDFALLLFFRSRSLNKVCSYFSSCCSVRTHLAFIFLENNPSQFAWAKMRWRGSRGGTGCKKNTYEWCKNQRFSWRCSSFLDGVSKAGGGGLFIKPVYMHGTAMNCHAEWSNISWKNLLPTLSCFDAIMKTIGKLQVFWMGENAADFSWKNNPSFLSPSIEAKLQSFLPPRGPCSFTGASLS